MIDSNTGYSSIDNLDYQVKKDIIGWDVINWLKALKYWKKHCDLFQQKYLCLEIGSGKSSGGLSLWLALNGNYVICSDLKSPRKYSYPIHQKYSCAHQIEYQSIDAVSIPYNNYFDIVAFKSVLGGISRKNNELKKLAIDNIYHSLKPGGRLLFAENLDASVFHRFARNKLLGKTWNYLNLEEVGYVFGSFKSLNYKAFGFFGSFGRNETQRVILGCVDTAVEFFIPAKMKYILVGIAQK